jgi:hypothetical protein
VLRCPDGYDLGGFPIPRHPGHSGIIPHLGFVFAAVARKRCRNLFASIGQRFVTMSRDQLFCSHSATLGSREFATPGLEVCSPTSQKIKGRLYGDVSFFASITAKVSVAPPRVAGI